MYIKKISITDIINRLILTGLALFSVSLPANQISIKQMTNDVTYLASDRLKGRANFSKEIDIAADYISQRFDDIGLKPFNGLSTFKQTFNVTKIVPSKIFTKLNNRIIPQHHIAVASTLHNLSWQNKENIKTHVIDQDKDFREILRSTNNEGGYHLILVNKAHKRLFTRYQHYFNRGLTKLKLSKNPPSPQGAIVLVLTNQEQINQIDIKISANVTEQSLSNVLALLPGKSKSSEIVMFSAHYDHLGTTLTGKEIYNGADDNASGTSAIINLAEYFATKKSNERTLLFAAFTGEEIGGYGSRFLSDQINPKEIIAMLNIEMIGKPSKFGAGTLWMTGSEHSNLGVLLNKSLSTYNTKIYEDPYPEQNLFYRSDNATLARLGVPAHTFSSTQLDKDIHYHKTTDDIKSLDLSSMHKAIKTLSVASESLINGNATPTRIDISKINSTGKIF